jgi:hypothetical protein
VTFQKLVIRPAGMSYERALQIAIDVELNRVVSLWPSSRVPDEAWEKVLRLHRQGMSDRQIARVMGTGRNTAFSRRRALGLPSNQKPGRPSNASITEMDEQTI